MVGAIVMSSSASLDRQSGRIGKAVDLVNSEVDSKAGQLTTLIVATTGGSGDFRKILLLPRFYLPRDVTCQ